LWQNVDYYILLINIHDGEVKKELFVLTHEDMKHEVETCGHNAHGTRTILTENTKIEKRITLTLNDIERWKKTYYHKTDFELNVGEQE
jgi:hypothetical protein